MTPLRALAVAWAVGGVLLLLVRALVSLTPMAVAALQADLGLLHWAFAVAWVGFMAYTEGYKGFQQRFSPRVVRRAWHLGRHPTPWLVLLGPLFAMGLVHATRRRLIASWVLVAGIVALVVAVRLLPQPWRGLVDLGVVVGLTWGAVSILAWVAAALAGRPPEVDPELPPVGFER